MAITGIKVYPVQHSSGKLSELTGGSNAEEVSSFLARSILRDSRLENAQIVIRRKADSLEFNGVYLFGDFSPLESERIFHLASQIRRADISARYVDYPELRMLCDTLAEKLLSTYGRNELKGFSFVPIPRGGHLVFGLLSYALDMKLESCGFTEGDQSRPLMLIDDCVFSAVNLIRYIGRWPGRDMSAAVLFAPPGMVGIPRKLGGSVPLLSAEALTDYGPRLYGSQYPRWKDHWTRALGSSAQWIGQGDYLCFPWSEPEHAFTNRISGHSEKGFKLASAERCYANTCLPSAHNEVVELIEKLGPYSLSPGVVWARIDENRVSIADFRQVNDGVQQCFVLEDIAAAMWSSLVEHETIDSAITALGLSYDAPVRQIETDLQNLLSELSKLGLLYAR